jgi:hypothetical protein
MRGAVILAVLALAAPAARADDKKAAAEHFALAQSAERRRDWRAAIEEYEEAYRLSPHPSVLYNIALDQEHLAAWRDAARYFLRYLDESPQASDRDAVLLRVRGLREKPSSVTVDSRPQGARIYLEGSERGRAPVLVALAGGRTYEVIGMDRTGAQSRPQRITPEYGESVAVTVIVADDVDDEPLAPGNDSPDSQIGGAAPTATGGEVGPAGPPPPPGTPGGGPKLLSSGAFGYHTNNHGARITWSLGYRSPGDHVDVDLLVGLVGDMKVLGGDVRLYFTRTAVRPYLRAGWVYGWLESADSAMAYEGGAGLLTSTRSSASSFGLDAFVEVTGHRRTVQEKSGLLDPVPEDQDGSSLAVLVGVGAHIGR